MKRSFLFLFISFMSLTILAQKGVLFLKKSENGFHLEHKVVAKESFFSVGRLYHVHPRYLASYNKLDFNKGLFTDKIIRIPLSDTNFSQKTNKGTPLYYKAKEKDDWVSIAKTFTLSAPILKGWNKSSVKKRQQLIVGWLLSPELNSKSFVVKADQETVKAEEKNEKEAIKENTQALVVEEKKPEEKKSEREEEVKWVTGEKKLSDNNYQPGYFLSSFEQQIKNVLAEKEETVTCGIFKTSSGFQDAKYYLLMDNVSPGTIVKLVNPSNNRIIYGKVLGEMSGIRLNYGFNIRISNASAAALGIAEEDKFILTIRY